MLREMGNDFLNPRRHDIIASVAALAK
jgi:hypothetical protein